MTFNQLAPALSRRIQRFSCDTRGASAVEFAFILPLLLVMYLGALEVGTAIDTNKKNARIAASVGDLVAQTDSVKKIDIDAIMKIGEAILQPYRRSSPTIEVDGISVDATGQAKVSWSRKMTAGTPGAGTPAGTPVTIPAQFRLPNTFIVKSSSSLTYHAIMDYDTGQMRQLGWTSVFTTIPMSETLYWTPRTSNTSCQDC